jgi:hypothetical protein
MGDMSLYHTIHCALSGAPLMTIAVVAGSVTVRLIAGVWAAVRAALRLSP